MEHGFIESAGDRSEVQNVMVLLTDGEDKTGSPKDAAERAKAKNIFTVAIGIGDYDEQQLLDIVDGDKRRIAEKENFSALLKSTVPNLCKLIIGESR